MIKWENIAQVKERIVSTSSEEVTESYLKIIKNSLNMDFGN